MKNNRWTKEKCIEDALKYKSRKEWSLKSNGYFAARRKGFLDLCCSHMETIRLPNKYWNLENCKKDAMLYPSRKKWHKNSNGYQMALKNGWLEECCKHMPKNKSDSDQEKEILGIVKSFFSSASKKMFGKQINGKYATKFELDIYIPELNKGIEFNGTYYHSFEGLRRSRFSWSNEDIYIYHEIKRSFFNNLGIDYIDIWEEDWEKDKDRCLNKISNFLAIDNNKILLHNET